MVCAFGRPLPDDPTWTGAPYHCRGCQRFAERLQAEFARDVFFGLRDQDGYTPAERKRKGRAQ